MFHLATALLGIFVIIRFVLPLPFNRTVKFSLAIITITVSLHHLITRIVFENMFAPEVFRELIIVVNWIFGTILILTFLQLITDVFTLVLSLVMKRWIKIPYQIRYTIGIAALLLSAVGVSQAIRIPAVKSVEIPIKGLSRDYDGFRIVQLTDLHLSKLFQSDWATKLVDKTNALNADLIVITGDLIDGTIEQREKDIAPLQALRASYGVYVVPGNHEYYFGYQEWMNYYKKMGMKALDNSHVVINKSNSGFVLAGVTDLSATNHNLPAPNVLKAIQGAPSDLPMILLDHQPKNAKSAADQGVDLQLSGHTHGGSVLGFDKFIASFNNGFVSGLYDIDQMKLYVNNGTALWLGFALRLGVPSELTVITLKSR